MKFCSECGSAHLEFRSQGRDDHTRLTCADCGKVFYHNPKIIAGCIVEHEGKYLMCQRAIKPRTGTWTLPAGFMECGETVEDAAKRETWEETGARVEIIAPYSIFCVPQIDEMYVMFRAKLISVTDKPGPETMEARLMAPDEIPWDNIFYPAIRDILQRYIDETPQSSFGMYMGCSENGTVHFAH